MDETKKSTASCALFFVILILESYSLTYNPQLCARMEAKGFVETAPDKNVKPLQQHAEVTNIPRVGSEENFLFPAQQMNMAPAVRASDGEFYMLFTFDMDLPLLV